MCHFSSQGPSTISLAFSSQPSTIYFIFVFSLHWGYGSLRLFHANVVHPSHPPNTPSLIHFFCSLEHLCVHFSNMHICGHPYFSNACTFLGHVHCSLFSRMHLKYFVMVASMGKCAITPFLSFFLFLKARTGLTHARERLKQLLKSPSQQNPGGFWEL